MAFLPAVVHALLSAGQLVGCLGGRRLHGDVQAAGVVGSTVLPLGEAHRMPALK